MQYVFSALYGVSARKAIKLEDAVFGVIGVGNVGRKVAALAEYLGFKVLKCDPPRAEAEGPEEFCSLEYLLANSDVVSLPEVKSLLILRSSWLCRNSVP